MTVSGAGDFEAMVAKATADLTQRAAHDRANPAEPPQLRAGETVGFDQNGNPVVTSDAADSVARGALIRSLLEKNPGMSLTISDPEVATRYGLEVVPDGPVLKAVAPGTGGLDQATAGSAVNYWRQTAQQLGGDVEADSPLRRMYAVNATSQADWLLKNNHAAEAEQAYLAARDIAPTAFEPVERLARLLALQGRKQDAVKMMDQFATANPDMQSTVNMVKGQLANSGKP